MTNIKEIEILKIHPHPKNPRKDLGDLTELSQSIKKNGIYQNLTVVPYYDPFAKHIVKGEYTEVKITLDSGTEYSKIYKLGYSSDGSKINKHTTEYKRNGVPVLLLIPWNYK